MVFVVVRNPWGSSEWTGPWSDGSKEWNGEWLDALKELGHVFGNDGQFVMEYSDFLDVWETVERTQLFDASWAMAAQWLRLSPRPNVYPWTYGDVFFKFTLVEPSPTIIVLSELDKRYFEKISGTSAWRLDFVVYKRGDSELRGESYSGIPFTRSISCELNLEEGEYIVFPRLDREDTAPQGYFEEKANFWDGRTLARVLTERTKARSIAANYRPECNTLFVEKDLSDLLAEDTERLEIKESSRSALPVADDAQDPNPAGSPVESLFQRYMHLNQISLEDEDEISPVLGLRVYAKKEASVVVDGWVDGEDSDEDEKENEDETEE
ncbi:hypothetical protein NLJ89_g1658 [Agrocybe chaxingu]|uniref:Calpain catalytic domain-containing protein n=1 Tax=Agrocybe chaxingu TaxID=84603 RepID=A0A9W8TET7_9AGAR|nr:hypothetical protein NLJ89_g1658 [Agrocybe chaxingu]